MNRTEAKELLVFYKRENTNKARAHFSEASVSTITAIQNEPSGVSSPGAFCLLGRGDTMLMEGGFSRVKPILHTLDVLLPAISQKLMPDISQKPQLHKFW